MANKTQLENVTTPLSSREGQGGGSAVSVFRNFWDTVPRSSTLEAMVSAIQSDERTQELTEGYRRQHLLIEKGLAAIGDTVSPLVSVRMSCA